jgi:hypothetical protein
MALCALFADGLVCARNAVCIDDDRHIGAGFGQQGGFVADLSFFGAIAPRQDRGPQSLALQVPTQPDHKRGLAGSSGGDIADTDYRHVNGCYRQDFVVIEEIAKADHAPIQQAQ